MKNADWFSVIYGHCSSQRYHKRNTQYLATSRVGLARTVGSTTQRDVLEIVLSRTAYLDVFLGHQFSLFGSSSTRWCFLLQFQFGLIVSNGGTDEFLQARFIELIALE